MATLTDLTNALNGDKAESSAVVAAQAIVDTATATLATAQTALDDAIAAESADVTAEEAAVATATTALATANGKLNTAKSKVSNASTLELISDVKVTDFGMVSNDLARKIIVTQGKTVMFEEPVDVKSDYNMRPIA